MLELLGSRGLRPSDSPWRDQEQFDDPVAPDDQRRELLAGFVSDARSSYSPAPRLRQALTMVAGPGRDVERRRVAPWEWRDWRSGTHPKVDCLQIVFDRAGRSISGLVHLTLISRRLTFCASKYFD